MEIKGRGNNTTVTFTVFDKEPLWIALSFGDVYRHAQRAFPNVPLYQIEMQIICQGEQTSLALWRHSSKSARTAPRGWQPDSEEDEGGASLRWRLGHANDSIDLGTVFRAAAIALPHLQPYQMRIAFGLGLEGYWLRIEPMPRTAFPADH